MKLNLVSTLALAAVAHGHCIFQKVSVNGKEYGSLAGLRAPNQNNPVQDVTSNDIICGKVATSSKDVIQIAPGDKVGSWWQHVIGGAQFANDPDNPIAKSHKGPVTAWLAKVDSAANANINGLSWYKVAEDNLDLSSGKWGVDNMVANNGWSYFTMPTCIAPGEYLLRVELLALHSAHQQRGAQFYVSCANIKVSGSGTFTPSSTVQFPGAYQQNDASIAINIYGTGGIANNNNKQYLSPGPRAITC